MHSRLVDYVFLMAYNYHYTEWGVTDGHSKVYRRDIDPTDRPMENTVSTAKVNISPQNFKKEARFDLPSTWNVLNRLTKMIAMVPKVRYVKKKRNTYLYATKTDVIIKREGTKSFSQQGSANE